MTISDVERALDALSLSRFIPSFKHHGIDGNLLQNMDEVMLCKDFNFTTFEAMKLKKFAAGWSPQL